MCNCIDAVLNDKNQPIFYGTSTEIEEWLTARQDDEEVQKSNIMLGHNLRVITIDDYLANAKSHESPSDIMDDIRKRSGV